MTAFGFVFCVKKQEKRRVYLCQQILEMCLWTASSCKSKHDKRTRARDIVIQHRHVSHIILASKLMPSAVLLQRASRDPALRVWQCWWRVVEPTEAACRAAQLSSAPAASSSNFSSYRRCRHQLRSSPASSKEQHLRNASSQAFGKYQWIETSRNDGRTAKVHLPILDLCSSTLTSV